MTEIPAEQVDKLCYIVESFADSRLPKKSATLKGKFTRTVNQWAKLYGAQLAREAALNVVSLFWLTSSGNERLQILLNRVTLNSLYVDGETVWGWYCLETQAQAERLPLSIKSDEIFVNLWAFNKERGLWESRGFKEAVKFPYIRNDHPILSNLIVTVSRKDSDFWRHYGYAMPEELPYEREEDGLIVTRNIKEFGFWRAWKWWENCQDWYRDKHPEWFKHETQTTS